MQMKFLSLGLLAAVVVSVAADAVKVTDTDVKLHNTGSCIANNLKVTDVLNKLHANVANKKRSVLSRRKINDAVRHMNHARRSENEADEEEEDDENELDEEEEDENENEADEQDASKMIKRDLANDIVGGTLGDSMGDTLSPDSGITAAVLGTVAKYENGVRVSHFI